MEETSEKVHSELISLTEQAENSRKAVSKIHGQIDEFDEQICQLAAERQHDGDSLITLKSAIGDLEKLLQVASKLKCILLHFSKPSKLGRFGSKHKDHSSTPTG